MTDWFEKLQGLSEGQRQLLAERAREHLTARPRLLAFVAHSDAAAAEPTEIRSWIADRLPGHMVPDAIVAVEALPRLPNGKVDARALLRSEVPVTSNHLEIVTARSDAEEILVRIWSDLLGIDPISVEDDFFELGGDSLISIRMISMARQEGLQIKPSDLPDNPTIASLAKIVESDVVEVKKKSASRAPPTPIQSWHLTRSMPQPAHWNQAIRLSFAPNVEAAAVENALAAIVDRHVSLRAQFQRVHGQWQQYLGEKTEFRMRRQRLNNTEELEQLIQSTSQTFDLQGSLWAAIYLTYAETERADLLIVANHLIIDAVSWSIFLDDLDIALRAVEKNLDIVLPPAGSPLDWALEISDYADSDRAIADVSAWLNSQTAHPLKTKFGDEASAGTISASLDPDITATLLGPANMAFNTQPMDLMVWALAEAQSERTASSVVQIDIEGHGRQPRFSETDLSRTIGWLTAYFPVTLTMKADQVDRRGKDVKETLRTYFENGTSFGSVRYSSGAGALRTRLSECQTTDILFNYAGASDKARFDHFDVSDVPQSGLRAPENPRSHLFEFNLSVANGRLEIALTYGLAQETEPAAQAFLKAFRHNLQEIANYCMTCEAGGFTPSDFPETGLSQDELDAFLDEI